MYVLTISLRFCHSGLYSSSFEVTVDEKYVAYSKLTKGNFPDFKIVAKEVSTKKLKIRFTHERSDRIYTDR